MNSPEVVQERATRDPGSRFPRVMDSVVQRALAGLVLMATDHAGDLAARARRCLEGRDGMAAWLLCERLARLRSNLVADDLVLRALSLAAMNDREGAQLDIRAALAIDPGHVVANRLLLESANPIEREQAANRLLQPAPLAPHLGDALKALAAGGTDIVGSFEGTPDGIHGWIAWRGAASIVCRLRHGAGDVAQPVLAQPGHPLATAFAHAATVDWPWPPAADWVALACDAPRALLPRERLWRRDPLPASPWRAPPHRAAPAAAARKAAVIVPVYDDLAATRTCLEALLECRSDPARSRIIVVDDATPDPALAALLDELAREGLIELLRNIENLGFAASVNRALELLSADEDALLLNADTIPPRNLCERLARVAYSHDDIATVTPLSNNGEYTSLPVRFRENPLPQTDELAELDRFAATAVDSEAVDLPNGVGFCLYIKRAVLDAIGPLSARFGRGYYEDVEFCLRASAAGYRHVCAIQVFVGHAGTRSFKTEKRSLVVRNLARLDRLYPLYRRLSAAFVRQDPLRTAVGGLEWRWLQARQHPFVLLVCGSPRDESQIARYARAQRGRGFDTIVAAVEDGPHGMTIRLRDQATGLPQSVALSYAASDLPAAPLRDLTRLRLAGLAIADPASLPNGLVRGLAGMAIRYDVLLSDARICVDGPADHVLGDASRILPASERLARALTARAPHLAGKCGSLAPDDADKVLWRSASAQTRGVLLVVGDGPEGADSTFIRYLGNELRRIDAGAAIVVDGAMDDELATMAPANIFVLGRGRPDGRSPFACRVPVAAVLFPSRRWGMGDARVEQAMATGVPVAHFDASVGPSRMVGRDLLLSASEPVAAAVAALLPWWQGHAAGPASRQAVNRRPAPRG